MQLLSDPFPTKTRFRGATPTTAAVVYTVPVGAPPQILEHLTFNATASRTVDVAIVASGETYSAGPYDIASAVAVASGAPVKIAVTPQLLLPGDRIYVVASGASVTHSGIIAAERTNNNNYAGS